MYFGIVIVIALVVGFLVAGIHGDSRWGRWGHRKGRAVPVGASPYREGTSAPLVSNAAPHGLRLIAGVNAFWGVITGLIFVPAGAVLTFFASHELKLVALPLLIVLCSGFGLAFALGTAGARTLRRDRLEDVRTTLTWSIVHHAGVLVVMGLTSLMMNEVFVVAISVVPCLLGMSFAHLLMQGVERVELGGYDASDPAYS